MFFFKKRRDVVLARMEHMDLVLRHSFSKVKQDTQLMYYWIQYLQSRQQNHEQQLREIFSYLPSREEIRRLVDEHYESVDQLQRDRSSQIQEDIRTLQHSFEELRQKIDGRTQELDKGLEKLREYDSKIEELRSLINQPKKTIIGEKKPEESDKSPRNLYLREKIIRSISRNSKDYVKSMVYSMMRRYQKVSGLQLRLMVVEEQGLASKSSFYRILEEIEKESDEITVIREGKEKVYMFKNSVQNPSI